MRAPRTVSTRGTGRLQRSRAHRRRGRSCRTPLRQCTHCVSEVQRLIQLRTAMESPPQKAEGAPRSLGGPRGKWGHCRRLVGRLRDGFNQSARSWRSRGRRGRGRGNGVLVLAIVTLLARWGEVQFRGRPARESRGHRRQVIARARPSDDQPIVATLGHGTQATQLEESGGWTRIDPRGRRVWVRSQAVTPLRGSRPKCRRASAPASVLAPITRPAGYNSKISSTAIANAGRSLKQSGRSQRPRPRRSGLRQDGRRSHRDGRG